MSFLLALAGFLMLASGTWRQSAVVFGRLVRLRHRLALLCGGYALLGLSLSLILAGDDRARSLVTWFGQITAAATMTLLCCWLWQRRRTTTPRDKRR